MHCHVNLKSKTIMYNTEKQKNSLKSILWKSGFVSIVIWNIKLLNHYKVGLADYGHPMSTFFQKSQIFWLIGQIGRIRLAILKLNDSPDSLVMQPRSLEHCTVKALCILKPGNYNGYNLWACRGLVNKIGATMQHLFHNVIAAAFHLSVQWPLSGYWIIMK